MNHTCESCKFLFEPDSRTAICRRYPPNGAVIPVPVRTAVGNSMQLQTVAAFTPVQKESWCGEYSPKLTLSLPARKQ